MKRLIILIAIVFPFIASAQVQVNPQLGVTFQNLSKPPQGVDYQGKAGFKVGADLRLGKVLYFQPGIFLDRSTTIIKYSGADTFNYKSNFIRTSLQLKALAGYKLVNGDAFKLRAMAGPTYNVLLSVDNKHDDNFSGGDIAKSDLNNGSFNIDGGIGVDILFLTGEIGCSYGLSKAFKNKDASIDETDSKYLSLYFSVGVVFGK